MINTPFPLGRLVATPGAIDTLEQYGVSSIELLRRHNQGDWGDLCPEDYEANNDALRYGGRLLSAYRLDENVKVWIITEADYSATTILLPEEY